MTFASDMAIGRNEGSIQRWVGKPSSGAGGGGAGDGLRAEDADDRGAGDVARDRTNVEDGLTGSLPRAPLRVNPGHTEIRIEREGFEPFVEVVDLVGGATLRVDVVLRPQRTVGHLAIAATPSGARIVVDGVSRGITPLDLELASGVHRIEIRASDHVSRSFMLSLGRGESRRVDVQLVR